MSVTAILNAYNRLDLLDLQIKSLLNQTIVPEQIFIWNNSCVALESWVSHECISQVKIFQSPCNWGVWPRFFLGYMARSEFIVWFDDDTIPGRKWIENCLTCHAIQEGIYGTRGLKFRKTSVYGEYDEYGWKNPVESTVEVDLLGHSWFVSRKNFDNFGLESSEHMSDPLRGEDFHLCFGLKRSCAIASFVPPHPVADQELWGASPSISSERGSCNGVSSNLDSYRLFSRQFDAHVKKMPHSLVSKAGSKVNEGNFYEKVLNSRASLMQHMIKKSRFFPFLYRLKQMVKRVRL